MGILGWIVLGLLAGAIAKLLIPGEDPGGWIVTMILGIVGAVVGGFISTKLGFGGMQDFFSLKSWGIAIGGAMLLLVGYRLIFGRK